MDLIRFKMILLDFIGFYWILLDFIRVCYILLDFIIKSIVFSRPGVAPECRGVSGSFGRFAGALRGPVGAPEAKKKYKGRHRSGQNKRRNLAIVFHCVLS